MAQAPSEKTYRAIPAISALAGPAAAVAAVGSWWSARGFVAENRYAELGRDHLAAAYVSDRVLDAVGLTLCSLFVGLLALWTMSAVRWLAPRMHALAWVLAGLVGSWVVLVLWSPRGWTVARIRDDVPVPNLFWMLRAQGPAALVWCAGFVAAGLALGGVAFVRARDRVFPGPRWSRVGAVGSLVTVVACAWALALPRLSPPASRSTTETVVFLTWDSTRADHLSAYGHERETTPEVDALAADAVLFERGYANHNWTRPSYMTMLTGRPGWEVDLKRVRYSRVTMAEALKDAGFATRAFVQNPNLDFSFRLDQGFDRYYQFKEDALASEVAAQVVRAIGQLADEPFFLFVHIEQPHWPYLASDGHEAHPPFTEPYDLASPPVSKFEIEQLLAYHELEHFDGDAADADERLAFMRAAYDADIREADGAVGTILDALRAHGRYDEALILFNSDHGEEFFERGNFGHAHRNVYPELTRVPFVIRFPGSLGVEPHRSQLLVQNLDLYPTILDVVGLPTIRGLAGTSVLSLLRQPEGASDDRFVFSVFNGLVAVRTRNHTLLRDFKAEEPPLLFDVSGSPEESAPVAAPEGVPQFQTLLDLANWWAAECWVDGDADLPGGTDEMSPELLDRLRELGYLGD